MRGNPFTKASKNKCMAKGVRFLFDLFTYTLTFKVSISHLT